MQADLEALAGEPDFLTMSPAQQLVLDRMSNYLGYPFRDIASDCGLSEKTVRAIIHHFHAMGMTGFGPLYSEENGHICGKGYWLSRRGDAVQIQVRKHIGWRALHEMREPASLRALSRTAAEGEGRA